MAAGVICIITAVLFDMTHVLVCTAPPSSVHHLSRKLPSLISAVLDTSMPMMFMRCDMGNQTVPHAIRHCPKEILPAIFNDHPCDKSYHQWAKLIQFCIHLFGVDHRPQFEWILKIVTLILKSIHTSAQKVPTSCNSSR